MIDLDAVRAAISIVDLVGETVRLKKQGAQFYGLCPFHSDKSPTLRVDPKKQLWMCPSCQIGGDCFSWLKHRDGISFRVAAQDLAKRAGIEPGKPGSTPAPIRAPSAPKFPAPRHEPNLPWGGQHLLTGCNRVRILNEFPGRGAYLRMAEIWPDEDLIWWPAPWATAERMYLAPIARAAVTVQGGTCLADQYRADALMLALEAWRGCVKVA